jgi:C1A family cysteine protease
MSNLKMGWSPDLPDFRDLNMSSRRVRRFQRQIAKNKKIEDMPSSIDLSKWCSPIEDQQNIGSCTAQSGVGLLEYFQNKFHGKHIDGSRLFLYKTTRNLMGLTGDTGAYLRSTMKAMVLFGVCPEKFYPYDVAKFDEEPQAFHYSLAQNFQSLKYYRLDGGLKNRNQLLQRIKTNLYYEMPAMFGFTVFSSLYEPTNPGEIPYPSKGERVYGGHAVVAVGFDDAGWGEEGYGWLPYHYVVYGLARDWWSLMNNEWVDLSVFN